MKDKKTKDKTIEEVWGKPIPDATPEALAKAVMGVGGMKKEEKKK